MLTLETAQKVLHFVIGKPHEVMGFMYLMVFVNMMISVMRKKGLKQSLSDMYEAAFAYTAFMILANVLDRLMINNLFGWDGSTQFMFCLFAVAREARKIYTYLTERFGFTVPILEERLSQMENGQTNPDANWQDPSIDLDRRIERMRNELDLLESRRNAAQPVPQEPAYEPGTQPAVDDPSYYEQQ